MIRITACILFTIFIGNARLDAVPAGHAHRQIESFEIGEHIEVQFKTKWFTGFVVEKRGQSYDVDFFDHKTGVKQTEMFFPPEMRKTNGEGFQPAKSEIRKWISIKGTEAIASLIFCDGKNVILQRSEKVVVVPIAKLSEEDRTHLNQLRASLKKIPRPSTRSSVSNPTPFKDILGMDKDEFLKKMNEDQERMLKNMSPNKDDAPDVSSNAGDDISEMRKLLTQQMESLGSGNSAADKANLKKIQEQLEKLKGGGSANATPTEEPEDASSEPGEQDSESGISDNEPESKSTVLNDSQYGFQMEIPEEFEQHDSSDDESTLYRFGQPALGSRLLPTIIRIERLGIELDAKDTDQIRVLEKKLGEPVDKRTVEVSGTKSEIWKFERGDPDMGQIASYTLFIPLKIEALRVSVAGRRGLANQNLQLIRSIAKSTIINSNRIKSDGYVTAKNNSYQTNRSGQDQFFEDPLTTPSARRTSTDSQRTGRMGKGIVGISIILAVAGFLVFVLYRVISAFAPRKGY